MQVSGWRLLSCGDISSNPGPALNCNKFSVCRRSVAHNHRAIQCDLCLCWCHIKCGKDTRRILVEFLSNQLGFYHPKEIEFQRLHRIGKKGDRPRMIIACFLRYADRERVMKNAFKLKETDFKIFEDLPKELFSLRKKYLPAFYEAKKAGKKAVFSKSEPNKLFIDGKLVV